MTFNILLDTVPVYAFWLRVSKSKHEALFSTGVYAKEWDFFEFSAVRGPIPVYQSFTESVVGDFNVMALEGHEHGPLAPHFCNPPDNTLLPITWISANCKWPVTASRRLHGDKKLCVFGMLAPYLHCHARQAQEEDPAAKPPSDKLGAKLEAKASAAVEQTLQQVPGCGYVMIPTGAKTIWVRLDPLDILKAAVAVLWDAALDAAWGRVQSGKPGPDRHVSPFKRDDAVTTAAVLRQGRDKLVDDAAKDVAKSLVNAVGSGQLGAPFKLAQLDFRTGKLTLWTHEFDGWKPGDFPVAPLEPSPDGRRDPQRAMLDQLLAGAPHAG